MFLIPKFVCNWVVTIALLFGSSTLYAQNLSVREKVSFTAGTALDGGVKVNGELRIPSTSGEKIPAVIVIHNAGGLEDNTGTRYIDALNAAGVATLELDLFPRGGRPASTRSNLPHMYGSLIYLAKHQRVDPKRIGVMGFSWGGVMSLVAASDQLTRAYTGGTYQFAAHLPLYPVCWAHIGILQGKNKAYDASIYQVMTGAPVHILAGEKDVYDEPDTCVKFIQALPTATRTFVSSTVYPGAGHGWDTLQERQYMDHLAYMGRGGNVPHLKNSVVSEKSIAFAVEFFTR